jgi:hypothetical protein
MNKIEWIRDGKRKNRDTWAVGLSIFIMFVLGYPFVSGRPLTEDLNFIYRCGILLLAAILLFWMYRVIDNLISKKISKPKNEQKQ